MKALPPLRISAAVYDRLRDLTCQCLQACRHEATDGTVYYGLANELTLRTRDFCYLVEGAGGLVPAAELLAGIDYLLARQRDDGLIPESVGGDGVPMFEATVDGQPAGSGPPADNAAFMAKLLCTYARLTGDFAALQGRLERLEAALELVPRGPDGLVIIDRNNPRPDYGYTDSVAKTGKTLFASLLYWEACSTVAATYRYWEHHDEAHEWSERAEQAGARLQELWSEGHGMMWAASRDCRQPDIWGSAYAGVLRAASKTQTTRIANYLLHHWAQLSYEGYVRHLPAGQQWQRTLLATPEGSGQNGGYWALPAGWIVRTVATVDEAAARRIVETLVDSFSQHGVYAWVSPQQRVQAWHLPGIANLLGSVSRAKG
jgi:hypothetical protein